MTFLDLKFLGAALLSAALFAACQQKRPVFDDVDENTGGQGGESAGGAGGLGGAN